MLGFLLLISGNLQAQIATQPANFGTAEAGEAANPYEIANLNNLYWLSQHSEVWDKDFIQTADIDTKDTENWGSVDNAGFSPIGNISTGFTGVYDGQKNTISNLFINRSTTNFISLFGYNGASAEIKNLGLIDVNITGKDYVSGLAGYNTGNISNTYSTGNVTGNNFVGSLVGTSNNGDISNSYSTGNVTGNLAVGGIAGSNTGDISNSYSTGNVTGNSSVGGLLGSNTSGGTVSNSYWNTETSEQVTSAGSNASFGKTSAEMKIEATFLGWDFTDTWKIKFNSYPILKWQIIEKQPANFGTADAGETGNPYEIANLNNLYWLSQHSEVWDKDFIQTADIDATETSTWGSGDNAGFSPIGNTSQFTGVYDGQENTISNLFIYRPNTNAVGLFSSISSEVAEIKNLGLIDVDITGGNNVGGLVGANIGSISNTYSTGNVIGKYNNSAGLVGYNNGNISNSYSTVNVTGINYSCGGLVGFNDNGNISNSYSTGNVTGNNNVGGLVGASGGTVSNSYWNTETSTQATSAGSDASFGKTSAEMKIEATFIAWDFANTWKIKFNINDGYPAFQWQHGKTEIIPSDVTITVATDSIYNNLIIDGNLIINGGITLTITGNLTIKDNGNLKNDGGTVTIAGNKIMERNISGNNYHFMSFPISGIHTNDITPQSANTHIHYYSEGGNLHWNELTSAGSLNEEAYAIKYVNTTTMSITSSNDFKTGGSVSINNSATGYGWNLVGNPYPCSVDLLSLEDNFSNVRNNTVYYMGSGGSYITYNATGEGSGTTGSSRYIPKMQGFFVQCRSNDGTPHDISVEESGTITFTDATKVIETPAFYKKATENTKLKLKVSNENYSHESIICFNENANNDYDLYDSNILFADNEEVPHIYTVIGDNELVINTYENPMTENLAVNVGFKVGVEGDYTISTNVFDAFSSEQNLYLEDKVTNEFINLQDNLTYNFHTEATDGADRFVLHFSKKNLEKIADKSVKIYSYEKNIYIDNPFENANVIVYDITGRKVFEKFLNEKNIIKLDINQKSGTYFVKFYSNNKIVNEKVIIK